MENLGIKPKIADHDYHQIRPTRLADRPGRTPQHLRAHRRRYRRQHQIRDRPHRPRPVPTPTRRHERHPRRPVEERRHVHPATRTTRILTGHRHPTPGRPISERPVPDTPWHAGAGLSDITPSGCKTGKPVLSRMVSDINRMPPHTPISEVPHLKVSAKPGVVGLRMFFWTVRRPVQDFCGIARGSSSPVTS